MHVLLILFALGAAPASDREAGAEVSPPPAQERLWVDWRRINADSVSSEASQLQAARGRAGDPRSPDGLKAQALGERVGEMVATGDCAEGERMARNAGDMALVRAVRDYCYK